MKRELRAHLLCAITTVFVVLAAVTGSAGAVSGVSFRPSGNFTQTGEVRISEGEVRRVQCKLTLSGSFSSSLVPVSGEGAQIGAVTGMRTSECSEGSVTGVLFLPWPLKLQRLNEVNPRYAVAGGISTGIYWMERFAVNVRYNTGAVCLLGGRAGRLVEFISAFTVSGGATEYVISEVFGGSIVAGECGAFFAVIEFGVGSPSSRPVFTFLAGNEVIDGLTPNPVEFGTVEVGSVTQRRVTIGSTRGGRIEEIAVTAGRYFAITDPNECRGRVLGEGGTCSINAIFSAPTEAGRGVTDTLVVRIAGTRYEATLRGST